MMGPAHVDVCRRAGKVCMRYVDRPVASGAHYEFSLLLILTLISLISVSNQRSNDKVNTLYRNSCEVCDQNLTAK